MKYLWYIKYYIETFIDEWFDKSGYFQPVKTIRMTLFIASVVAKTRTHIRYGD
jgi:hypothetical protein